MVLAKQMPSCSKNVVQVAANRGKLRIEGEQNGEKRLDAFCLNLPFSCGLRRLRQDLINSIPRFEGRCSIQLSYGREGVVYRKFRVVAKQLDSRRLSWFLQTRRSAGTRQ